MKTTANLFRAVLMTVFAAWCGSVANAQMVYPSSLPGATLIYSNSFTGLGTVNITNTTPDFSSSLMGGSNNAAWLDVGGGQGQTNNLYANGAVGTELGDTWLLPFTPQSGYVYSLSATVNFTGNPGSWVVVGLAQHYAHYAIASAPPNGSINIYDWTLRNFTGNTEYFGGAGSGNPIYNATPATSTGVGTYTYTQILDTTSNKWVVTAFFNGVQLGSPFTYTANPAITALGIGQHTETAPATYQWKSLTLAAAPIVIGQQPVSANVDVGTAFTNTIVVAASTPAYQWFNNGIPISGATNAALVFNPVSTANISTNYYVVVTNSLGSITSSVVSLLVYTNPVIAAAYPVAYTNPLTLFGGTTSGGTNFVGSSPSFSVSVLGAVPLVYQWQTNGVAVGGATNASFTFTNCQLSSPTSFACTVSNSFGMATNTWAVSYVQTPFAPFPQAVLACQPLSYWRLDEGPDDYNGDDGVLAIDSESGYNGIYTNAYLGLSGYSSVTDPNETAVDFSAFASPNSAAIGIQGINFAAPTNNSVGFSVSVWVNGTSQANNAGIVAKGYLNAEQFVVDTTGNKYRFQVHNAAGTLYSAVATVGPNGTWQHVVGVCNETNGTVAIYVNGLQSASVAIPAGSGVLASSVPVTIGARSTSATTGYDLQFSGELDDAAVFNYALSSAQVGVLYAAAGNSIPLTFIAPVPPTNAVYHANTTLTISATVYGAPTIGYYWTNLTTATLLASGSTTAFGNYNVSLTITNASGALSGDLLELVVTNAISTTNWFVTLFSPPAPVTLSYSSPILYSNNFNGGTWSIGGMPLTAANSLMGGTNTTWTDALGTNDTGSMMASGIDNSPLGDSWLLPFTPHSGYVYSLTGSLTFYGNPGSWVGLGFAQNVPTNSVVGYGRFSDGGTTPPSEGPNGYDWIILTESSGNAQYFTGAGGSGPVTNINGFFTAGAGTHTVTVVLDTTGSQWVMSAYVDGVPAGTNIYASNPPIGAIGITQTTLASPNALQWNSLSLTQVAPNGVPPYLLSPVPPTNSISLTNATVAIPATAFGSGPLGYYWSDNSTVIASGLTNTMAPLPANLSIASSSLSAGQLELVVTNAYGTNITLITLVSPINPAAGPIHYSVAGNLLTLSWPTNLGWTLLAQTNALSVGLSTNWVKVAGSTSTNQITIPVDPNNGSVFYRLSNP